MFQRILVALDGSADSRSAAELALRLARHFDSRLSALFVIDSRILEGPTVETLAPLWGEISSRPFRAQVLETWKDRSRQELDWFRKRSESAVSEAVDVREVVGLPEERILEASSSADLVVMGRRGENAGFGRHEIGSTLARVLRHAPHPVLAVKRPADAGEEADRSSASELDVPRIALVACDGREHSTRALDLAIRYCNEAPAELRLVTAGGEEADTIMEAAQRLCEDHGVEWESVRIDAEPGDAVAEAADRWGADCLFMGAFGHSRLHDLVLGSRTGEILDAVSVPVFLVT